MPKCSECGNSKDNFCSRGCDLKFNPGGETDCKVFKQKKYSEPTKPIVNEGIIKLMAEKPKKIYECSYIILDHYPGRKGTINVASICEESAKGAAKDTLYQTLKLKAGTVEVLSAKLIGQTE